MGRRPCLRLPVLMYLLLCGSVANVTGMIMLRRLREGVLCYLSVSNTMNIITYTDVSHDWQGRGRGWGCCGIVGENGVGG